MKVAVPRPRTASHPGPRRRRLIGGLVGAFAVTALLGLLVSPSSANAAPAFKTCVLAATISFSPPISNSGVVASTVTGTGSLTTCVNRQGVGVAAATFTISGSGSSVSCYTPIPLTLQISYTDGTSSTVSLTPILTWTTFRGSVTAGADRGRTVVVASDPDPGFSAACDTNAGASSLTWTGTYTET
jgi:hypothetical protein